MEPGSNMDKEVNYQADLPGLNYPTIRPQQQQQQSMHENSTQPVDFMLRNPQTQEVTSEYCISNSPEKMIFADVMRFADFGPKLALNQITISEEDREQEVEDKAEEGSGIDFLKFPVLNDKLQEESLMANDQHGGDEFELRVSNDLAVIRENPNENSPVLAPGTEGKNKRKRPRTVKTSEEVESQRMTHIAVERNRRKQMNEHLRVLRSLMPGSYVQRGDQASIIGGAIEFVRELEQLLQCLESQKRRKLYGDPPPPSGPSSSTQLPLPQQSLFPGIENQLVELEETAECKSCLADVEVKMLGFDAMIKILSRRRPGQLIKIIAALEHELQLDILHTNITTIEQTVLYTFNVKVSNDVRFTAEDVAGSVQQIFSFIHANSSM